MSRVEDEATFVTADPVFLDRVISNLVENACKSDPSGAIAVEARLYQDDVFIRVVDHGPGIPPAARERIFQPFYALGQATGGLGSGLGLAICKGFLSVMGGGIWVEETSGGGATFAFSLPSAGSRR